MLAPRVLAGWRARGLGGYEALRERLTAAGRAVLLQCCAEAASPGPLQLEVGELEQVAFALVRCLDPGRGLPGEEAELVLSVLRAATAHEAAFLGGEVASRELLEAVLAGLRRLGAPSPAPVDAEPDSVQQRRSLVAAVANLCCRREWAHDVMVKGGGTRESGAVLLLENTVVDAAQPLLREWALLGLRNLCEMSSEARELIKGLEVKQCVQDPNLRAQGLRLELDPSTNKPKLARD